MTHLSTEHELLDERQRASRKMPERDVAKVENEDVAETNILLETQISDHEGELHNLRRHEVTRVRVENSEHERSVSFGSESRQREHHSEDPSQLVRGESRWEGQWAVKAGKEELTCCLR